MKTLIALALPLALVLGLSAAPAFAQTHANEAEAERHDVAGTAAEGDHGGDHGGSHGADDSSLFASPGTKEIATSVITLVIFLALVAVLGKLAWGPIVKGLEGREQKIRDDIEAAEKARAQAQAAQREYADQMSGAEQRVRDLMAQAQADGQQLATRIKMQAQEEAEEIKERAMRDIEQSRREAVEQVRTEAATLATAVAEKILRREVNKDDQQRLIDESLSEFQAVGAE